MRGHAVQVSVLYNPQEGSMPTSDMARRYQTKKILPGIKARASEENEQRVAAAAAAKSVQSRLTLCDPRDGSPPDLPVPGILQARTLEWVAISSSNASK